MSIPEYKIHNGDCLDVLKTMSDQSVQCCVTSPPYWGLRDYGHDWQLGLEKTPEEYVGKMVEIFKEIGRVLKDDGTVWLNLGDSYCGSKGTSPSKGGRKNKQATNKGSYRCGYAEGLKPKDIVGIPWRVAFALQADGWYLRQDIIWHKPNPMPESITDRCTKAHEYIFLLSKNKKYYYDGEAIKEKAVCGWDNRGSRKDSRRGTECNSMSGATKEHRNKRSIWTVTTKPYKEAHFAAYPPDLIKPCILAGCPEGGIVFDPFTGSGTTGEVCMKTNRNFVGIELNPEYVELAEKRIEKAQMAWQKRLI